jgi:hypothetical protein
MILKFIFKGNFSAVLNDLMHLICCSKFIYNLQIIDNFYFVFDDKLYSVLSLSRLVIASDLRSLCALTYMY